MTWLAKIPTYLSVPTTLDLLLALACWSKCSMSSNALLVDPSSSPSEDDGFPAVAKPGRHWKELRKIQTKKNSWYTLEKSQFGTPKMEEFQFSDDFPVSTGWFSGEPAVNFPGCKIFASWKCSRGDKSSTLVLTKNELCFESFFYMFFVGISYQPVCLIQSL